MGGLGNAALASAKRKAPGFALLGTPGEEADTVLELKSIADVALVGYPRRVSLRCCCDFCGRPKCYYRSPL